MINSQKTKLKISDLNKSKKSNLIKLKIFTKVNNFVIEVIIYETKKAPIYINILLKLRCFDILS